MVLTRRNFMKSLTGILLMNPVEALSQDLGLLYFTDDPEFKNDSDQVLLARMLFGEARSCSDEEKMVIAYTAIERVNDNKKYNGVKLRDTLLNHYDCFHKRNSQKSIISNPLKHEPAEIFENCLELSRFALNGKYQRFNTGATLYHTKDIDTPSSWDKSKLVDIDVPGNFKHRFYIER